MVAEIGRVLLQLSLGPVVLLLLMVILAMIEHKEDLIKCVCKK